MKLIRVAVSGALGRMGSTTCAAVNADTDLELAAVVDPGFGAPEWAGEAAGMKIGEVSPGDIKRYASLDEALVARGIDVIVDFTTPAVVRENIVKCVAHRMPVVVGTTGLSGADLATIDQQCSETGVPVLVAPNFAMGAVLMMEFAKQAAAHFRAVEIIELHHDRKLDAPSGTSRLTRERILEKWDEVGYEREVPIHSVRLPGLVAHQEVIFGGLGETLTIRHDSLTRESFMPGVVLAIKRIRDFQGLVVGLENVL
jgi:4-hydroxy-tetrahydrodipicolinate reductase